MQAISNHYLKMIKVIQVLLLQELDLEQVIIKLEQLNLAVVQHNIIQVQTID